MPINPAICVGPGWTAERQANHHHQHRHPLWFATRNYQEAEENQ
jgi:hypothetical protein